MPQTTALETLRAALTNVAPFAPYLTASQADLLRGKVCDAVDELKDSGAQPERVIIVVKGIFEQVGITGSGRRLLEDVTRWCIQRYFGRASPPA